MFKLFINFNSERVDDALLVANPLLIMIVIISLSIWLLVKSHRWRRRVTTQLVLFAIILVLYCTSMFACIYKLLLQGSFSTNTKLLSPFQFSDTLIATHQHHG